MAANLGLPREGSKYGPCNVPCQHKDCALTRAMSRSTCRYCDKPIGYGNRFYDDPVSRDQYVHAYCLESCNEVRL